MELRLSGEEIFEEIEDLRLCVEAGRLGVAGGEGNGLFSERFEKG